MTIRSAIVSAVLATTAAGLLPVLLAAQARTAPANTLTAAERAAGWRLLFDGQSLAGWRGFKSDTVPPGWRVDGGVLRKDAPVADIVSADQFGDFELELEWTIGEAGNSGIFYRGTEEYDRIYWSAPEYQLLDDARGEDNKTRLTCAGAAYALYPSPAGHLKPAGEWNRTRIVARGPHVEHWLNGTKLLEYRVVEPRLGSEGRRQQVRQVAALRPGHARSPGNPGRPRRHAGVSHHPYPRAASVEREALTWSGGGRPRRHASG